MENDDTTSRSYDFVIPFSPFERTILAGIKAQYHSQLEEAIKHYSTLEEEIQSHGSEVLRDVGKLIVALSDLHITGLPELESDIICDDNPESGPPGLGASLKTFLFQGWNFARHTGTGVLLSQTQYALKDYDGDRAQSYSGMLNTLVGMPHKKDFFRLKMLEEHNADIRNRLNRDPPPRLTVVPATSDNSFWDVILGMCLVGHQTQLRNVGKKADYVADNTYSIWQVAQQFSLAFRRPDNGILVEKYLLPLVASRQLSELRTASKERQTLPAFDLTPGDTGVVTADSQTPSSKLAQALLDILNIGARGGTTETSLPLSQNAIVRGPLHDPRGYVEIIPWMELEPISPTTLEEARIPIFLPHHTNTSHEVPDVNWMLWKPATSNFFDCHHLYTEDEVYQYCVENHWHFPGQFYGDRVVFAISPIKNSRFVDDLERFWDLWNDCALTVDPSDGQLFLLETIPGRNYRLRRGHHFIDQAGGLYFRNIVEAYAQQQYGDIKLSTLLGKKYNLKYQYMLRYIQPEQITNFNPKPLGSGSFGVVYGATWKQPSAFLCSMQPEKSDLAVVVKQILPKFHETEAIEKLLHELSTTFTALEGGTTSCVAFHGITTFRVDGIDTIQMAPNDFKPSGEERIFLVFERASEGNLLEFVEQHLINATREESWSVVVDALTCIASGLHELHQRHVMHGDLHPGNILVTKRYYPTEGIEEYDYLLIDFGGGGYSSCHSVTSSSGRFECRVGDYLAPEVKIGNRGSAEADVFSLGRIGQTLMSLRRIISSKKGSTDWDIIPKALKKILDDCTIHNSSERPHGLPLVTRFEKLYVPHLMEDEAAWSLWDSEGSDSRVLVTGTATIQPGGHVARARAQVNDMLRQLG